MYFPEIAVQVQVHPSSRCFLQVFPGILSECFSPSAKVKVVGTYILMYTSLWFIEVFFSGASLQRGAMNLTSKKVQSKSLPANSPMVFKKKLSREVKCRFSSKTSHPAAKHPHIFSLCAFISLESRFFFGQRLLHFFEYRTIQNVLPSSKLTKAMENPPFVYRCISYWKGRISIAQIHLFLAPKNAKALSNLAWGSIDTEGGEWVEGTQPGDS